MLILSRKRNEKIRIGPNGEITVMVTELRGDKVRIGISAPDDVPVHREEVFDAIELEKERKRRAAGRVDESAS